MNRKDKISLLIIGIALVAAVAVYAGQRIRIIDVDGATTPVKSAAVNVALTPAGTTTVSVSQGTGTFVTTGTLTAMAGAAPTVNYGTMTVYVGLASGDAVTNAIVIVTNVTITAAAPLTNATIAFATAAAVTNATGTGSFTGFSAAQANGILTNANLFYQMLQTY